MLAVGVPKMRAAHASDRIHHGAPGRGGDIEGGNG